LFVKVSLKSFSSLLFIEEYFDIEFYFPYILTISFVKRLNKIEVSSRGWGFHMLQLIIDYSWMLRLKIRLTNKVLGLSDKQMGYLKFQAKLDCLRKETLLLRLRLFLDFYNNIQIYVISIIYNNNCLFVMPHYIKKYYHLLLFVMFS
jgi:hypothetical protein